MSENSGRSEAHGALQEVRRLTLAGERRGLRPRWHNLSYAVAFGAWAYLFAEAEGGPSADPVFFFGTAVFILATWGLELIARLVWGTSPRWSPYQSGLAFAIAWISMFVVGTFGMGLKAWGFAWGPMVAGTMVGISTLVVLEARRRAILARPADGAA